MDVPGKQDLTQPSLRTILRREIAAIVKKSHLSPAQIDGLVQVLVKLLKATDRRPITVHMLSLTLPLQNPIYVIRRSGKGIIAPIPTLQRKNKETRLIR